MFSKLSWPFRNFFQQYHFWSFQYFSYFFLRYYIILFTCSIFLFHWPLDMFQNCITIHWEIRISLFSMRINVNYNMCLGVTAGKSRYFFLARFQELCTFPISHSGIHIIHLKNSSCNWANMQGSRGGGNIISRMPTVLQYFILKKFGFASNFSN